MDEIKRIEIYSEKPNGNIDWRTLGAVTPVKD